MNSLDMMYITIIIKWQLAPKRWETCDRSWKTKRARKQHDWHVIDEIVVSLYCLKSIKVRDVNYINFEI